MREGWEVWLFRVLAFGYGIMSFVKFLMDDMDGYYQRLIVALLFELLARASERRTK